MVKFIDIRVTLMKVIITTRQQQDEIPHTYQITSDSIKIKIKREKIYKKSVISLFISSIVITRTTLTFSLREVSEYIERDSKNWDKNTSQFLRVVHTAHQRRSMKERERDDLFQKSNTLTMIHLSCKVKRNLSGLQSPSERRKNERRERENIPHIILQIDVCSSLKKNRHNFNMTSIRGKVKRSRSILEKDK